MPTQGKRNRRATLAAMKAGGMMDTEGKRLAALDAYKEAVRQQRRADIFDGVLACIVVGILTFLGVWAWAAMWSPPQ